MKIFFDYVFYSIYYWNKKLDAIFNSIFPVGSDALFSAVWGIAFLHAMNLYAIYYGLIILLDLKEYMYRADYVLYVLFGLCFLCDYYYYIKSNKCRFIFAKYKRKKVNISGAIMYLILSTLMAGIAVLWANDKI